MNSETTPLSTYASSLLTKENAQVAGNFAKDKFQELRKQASDGDYSMRLLALLGGAMLVILSSTEILGKILFFNVVGALLDVYTFLLGIVVIILEGSTKNPLLPKRFSETIHKYALILRYVWGRGALYFIAGTLQCAQMGVADLLVGAFMSFVGIVYIVVGKRASEKLRQLKKSTVSEFTLRSEFHAADATGKGKLNSQGFKVLDQSLGLGLSKQEVEAAFLVMDKDNDGLITYEEFEAWWNSLDDTGTFQLV